MSNFEKTLNDADLRALWDALYSTVKEPRAPYNWSATVAMYARVEAEFNLRSERANAVALGVSVPLAHVGRGSIWEWSVLGRTRTGCTWPHPEGRAECSYCAGGPMWAPEAEIVSILAHGLSTSACDWVLSVKEDDTDPDTNNARVRCRCAHLMAGGSIESYTEAT